jgi:hypothetical protein
LECMWHNFAISVCFNSDTVLLFMISYKFCIKQFI